MFHLSIAGLEQREPDDSLTLIQNGECTIAPRQKNDTIFTLFLVGTHLPIVGADLLNFPMINNQ